MIQMPEPTPFIELELQECWRWVVSAHWIKWRESWKSASVVNAHLVDDSTIRQPGFALSLDNSGLSWTVSAPDKVSAVPVRRNGNFQTPICVPAVRPKRCHTLSNPAYRQDYTVACLNYTLQTMMPLPGWPVMAPNAYDNNVGSNKAAEAIQNEKNQLL